MMHLTYSEAEDRLTLIDLDNNPHEVDNFLHGWITDQHLDVAVKYGEMTSGMNGLSFRDMYGWSAVLTIGDSMYSGRVVDGETRVEGEIVFVEVDNGR